MLTERQAEGQVQGRRGGEAGRRIPAYPPTRLPACASGLPVSLIEEVCTRAHRLLQRVAREEALSLHAAGGW